MSSTIRDVGAADQKNINAVFTDKKDNSEMTASDFMKLFVTQMQNQDFTKPVDNSEMMNQITQFSNMQMMQQMASYSKSNYAMSLVGKTVTASRFTVGGELDTVTGTVDKVSMVDDEYVLFINGKKYTLEQIMSAQTTGEDTDGTVDASQYKVRLDNTTTSSATVNWTVPTEDETAAGKLKYSVYYSQEGPFDTVEQVEKGKSYGTPNQNNFTSETITGLEPGTAYYVNVVVTDEFGDKSVYSPTLVLTKKE